MVNRMTKGMAIVLFAIGVSGLNHSLGLMDSSNDAMRHFGQLNLLSYLIMMLASILLFMKKKAGLVLGYLAFIITGVGLTQTGFYNSYSLVSGSFGDAISSLGSRDFLWMLFSAGVLALLIFLHTQWQSDGQKNMNCEQGSST